MSKHLFVYNNGHICMPAYLYVTYCMPWYVCEHTKAMRVCVRVRVRMYVRAYVCIPVGMVTRVLCEIEKTTTNNNTRK